MNKIREKILIGFSKSVIPALSIVAMIDYHKTKIWAAYLGFFTFIFGFIINEFLFGRKDDETN